MKVECKDLERVLREQEPVEISALETHAKDCNACRAELDVWNEISVAARTMRHHDDDPRLWVGIRARLQEEKHTEEARRSRWNFSALWEGFRWQAAAAVAAVLLLLAVNFKILAPPSKNAGIPPDNGTAERRLLTDKALKETQTAEAAYVQSIEKLAVLAEPKLEKADTPLAANYREKLLLLDAAIAECRKQTDGNKYNAHLQRELTSLYQEKKRTLEAVLRED